MWNTKQELVEAFVGNKLVNEYLFFSFHTKPENSNQISVLKFCDETSLILELLYTLCWFFRQPFHRNLWPILKWTLQIIWKVDKLLDHMHTVKREISTVEKEEDHLKNFSKSTFTEHVSLGKCARCSFNRFQIVLQWVFRYICNTCTTINF